MTGEEQWKKPQKLESRHGRGKRRKKTLAEQLEEMGGFGKDPDSEQAIIAELERDDTRAPLQQSQRSAAECEVFFGESSFWESRKRLFRSWIFQAKRPRSWIQEKNLPLFFRFALRRPIMDERTFQGILKEMNLQLDDSRGNARQPFTRPLGRSRKLLFGIDGDVAEGAHPSSKYIDVLPRGAAEDADGAREEVRRISQHDDEDMQELLRTQLWAVYEHVQDGSVSLETATWHYRDAFDKQDMSDRILVLCLQQFGIPTDHISNNEQGSPQGSAPSQSAIGEAWEHIAEIRNYVELYRSGGLPEDEAIRMIRHSRHGLKFEPDDISDVLTDLEKDERTAALLIWEDAWEAEDDDHISSSSSSSSEDEDKKPYENHENSLRANMVPDPHANDENDQNAAVGLPVDEIKPPGRITTEDSHKSEAIMDPPAMPSSKLSIHSHADKAGSSVLPPESPRPSSVLSDTETFDSQGEAALDREPPDDRANVGHRRTSSPDEGMTTGIWGLLMPTKEARKLAHALKLPQATINKQVRSISLRRESRRRASHAENVVTLPKSKRKASIVLHKGTAPKSPKHSDYSDSFAREGEDQETFVLSHFDGDKLPSVPVCDKCLFLRCQCGYESSSCSEPECPESFQVDRATQATSAKGSLSFDAPVTELDDEIQAGPSKHSVTLLAYLARVLDDKDVLASIKQLERLPKTVETVAYAKKVREHIRQGTCASEGLVIAGMEDREAVRIIHGFVQSLHTLANHSEKPPHEIKEEDNSTINVSNYHDKLQEDPDLGLGLLNSNPDNEHVHAPPSDHISSAAAFPEKQSKAANDAVFQANNTPLAKGVSPYLPTAAPDVPDSTVLDLIYNSGIEDAAQPSRFQAATAPDSSTAGDSSRSENPSRSPGGCKNSPAGGRSSQTNFSSESPAGGTLSPTADLSEQVSDNPVGAEVDTDGTFGAPFTKQPHSDSQGIGGSNGEMRSSLPLRSAARQLDDNISPPSPRAIPPPSPPLKQSSKDVPSATSRLGSREISRESKATHQSDSPRPGFENLPLWPPQPELPGKDAVEWMGMTRKRALDHAKKKAFSERKSLAFYLEERRAIRTRIKRENDLANSKWSDHSFFQSSNGLSGSSGTVTTQALNKLFDKYRGTSNIYLRSLTQPC